MRKRKLLTASFMLASLFLGAMSAPAPARTPGSCPQLFRVAQGKHAARVVYRGTRQVTPRNLRLLGYIERCQFNPGAQWYVRWYDRRQARLHAGRMAQARQRRYEARLRASMHYAVASWYYDAGNTASGMHAYYGFASLIYGFGTRIEFCYQGRCIVGTDDDHGPYVSGRTFDLNQNMARALGFDGVATVGYHVV